MRQASSEPFLLILKMAAEKWVGARIPLTLPGITLNVVCDKCRGECMSVANTSFSCSQTTSLGLEVLDISVHYPGSCGKRMKTPVVLVTQQVHQLATRSAEACTGHMLAGRLFGVANAYSPAAKLATSVGLDIFCDQESSSTYQHAGSTSACA